MQLLFRTLRFLLKLLLGLVACIGLYVLCAQFFSAIQINEKESARENAVPVFIKSNGVHTDIIVPVKNSIADWRDTFPVESFERVDTFYQYIAFGWGDKGFYLETPTWNDLKTSTALKALFFMSSTAMHVTYKKNEPKQTEDCVQLLVSGETYRRLCAEISASFNRTGGKLQLIEHPGYGNTDNFYEAIGTYSFITTCNVWTGRCLKNSGIRVGWWTPFDWNVLHSLESS